MYVVCMLYVCVYVCMYVCMHACMYVLFPTQHHCRRCGDVVCGQCCDRTPLTRMGYVDPVLVCHTCVPVCKTEEEFMHHQLKLLVHGT